MRPETLKTRIFLDGADPEEDPDVDPAAARGRGLGRRGAAHPGGGLLEGALLASVLLEREEVLGEGGADRRLELVAQVRLDDGRGRGAGAGAAGRGSAGTGS